MAADVDFADERIEKELASALAARVVYREKVLMSASVAR